MRDGRPRCRTATSVAARSARAPARSPAQVRARRLDLGPAEYLIALGRGRARVRRPGGLARRWSRRAPRRPWLARRCSERRLGRALPRRARPARLAPGGRPAAGPRLLGRQPRGRAAGRRPGRARVLGLLARRSPTAASPTRATPPTGSAGSAATRSSTDSRGMSCRCWSAKARRPALGRSSSRARGTRAFIDLCSTDRPAEQAVPARHSATRDARPARSDPPARRSSPRMIGGVRRSGTGRE